MGKNSPIKMFFTFLFSLFLVFTYKTVAHAQIYIGDTTIVSNAGMKTWVAFKDGSTTILVACKEDLPKVYCYGDSNGFIYFSTSPSGVSGANVNCYTFYSTNNGNTWTDGSMRVGTPSTLILKQYLHGTLWQSVDGYYYCNKPLFDGTSSATSNNPVQNPYWIKYFEKSIDTNTTTVQRIGVGFDVSIPYDILSENMTGLQFSKDGTNYYPIFSDENGTIPNENINSENIYSDSLTFHADSKTMTGHILMHYDLSLGVNNLKLYIKSVSGQVFVSDTVSITRNSIPTGGTGSGGNSTGDIRNPFHESAPVRSDYEDGIIGDVQFGFATLFYWLLFPIRLIGELVYTLLDSVSKMVNLASGATDSLGILFASFPSWIVTPFVTVFTCLCVIAIISFLRR